MTTLAVAVLLGIALQPADAQATAAPGDPSPHQVRMVNSDCDFPPADRVNLAAFRGKPAPVAFPPAGQRRLDAQPIDPVIRKATTEDHRVRPEYARIKVPVLAIYRSTTLEQALQDFPPGNEREREAVELAVAARRTVCSSSTRPR
jgi:hypothetical protein